MQNPSIKRIFISCINTQLGYHLTQTLRQDHKYLQNYPLISGTLSNESQQYLLHDSIHNTYNFEEQRDLTVKNAIESDVLIFDVRFMPAVQVEFILKVLKHYNLKKPITVIGISNYMTWSNCKTTQFITAPTDKQTLLQYSLNKQQWKQHYLSPQNYKCRVPHPMFAYNHQLQQIIMNLKHHNKFINSRIICTGVLCGKSGFDLKDYIKTAVDCNSKNQSPLFELLRQKVNDENYKLPFLHVDELLSEVQTVVETCLQNKQTSNRVAYKVLSSYQSQNVFKIIDQIYKLAGNYSLIDTNKQQQRQNQRQQSRQALSKQPRSSVIGDKSLGSNLLHIPQIGDQMPPSSRRASNNNLSALTSSSNINSAAPILQILCKSNKMLLSLMTGNISFKPTQRSSEQREQATVLNQVKISEKIYRQFLQCYQVEFKHLLISEQTMHQIGEEKNKQLHQKLINKYYLLDKHQLCTILQQLIKQGTLVSQRAPTPQQQKKKNPGKKNDTRESLKKEQYELFFAQLLVHFFKNNNNKNYIICLKKELIQRLLMLLRQQEFAQFHELKFTLLCLPNPKQSSSQQTPHKQQQSSSVNSIQKTIQLFSKQYNQQFQIQTDDSSYTSIKQIQHFAQTPQYHVNVTNQIKKSINNANNNNNDEQQVKINLISQYLLDNLVIYAAEAKQQLKLKGKLNIGQKFEGKQNIKLFIQELKRIRERETILANQQEQENIC